MPCVFVCKCTCTHAMTFVWRSENSFVALPFSYHEFWGGNSGHQACAVRGFSTDISGLPSYLTRLSVVVVCVCPLTSFPVPGGQLSPFFKFNPHFHRSLCH